MIVFLGDVSGESSDATVHVEMVQRLTPGFEAGLPHISNKSELTINDLKSMCFPSFSARPDSSDLASFLADYHVPFLVGHSVKMHEFAPRQTMVYFEFDSQVQNDLLDSQDSAIYSDYDIPDAPFRYLI